MTPRQYVFGRNTRRVFDAEVHGRELRDLAFMMGAHRIIGARSRVKDFDPEVLKMVVEYIHDIPPEHLTGDDLNPEERDDLLRKCTISSLSYISFPWFGGVL